MLEIGATPDGDTDSKPISVPPVGHSEYGHPVTVQGIQDSQAPTYINIVSHLRRQED